MLDGRTILVTGASTGIGRTTALFLAADSLWNAMPPRAHERTGLFHDC